MVDLQPLFAVARDTSRSVIESAGCTVRVETRTEGPGLTDADDIETLGTHVALIASASDFTATQPLPGLDLKTNDWKVLLLPETTPPPVGAWVVCLTNPHPHLIGQEAKVLGYGVDPSGSVLLMYARPEVTR